VFSVFAVTCSASRGRWSRPPASGLVSGAPNVFVLSPPSLSWWVLPRWLSPLSLFWGVVVDAVFCPLIATGGGLAVPLPTALSSSGLSMHSCGEGQSLRLRTVKLRVSTSLSTLLASAAVAVPCAFWDFGTSVPPLFPRSSYFHPFFCTRVSCGGLGARLAVPVGGVRDLLAVGTL